MTRHVCLLSRGLPLIAESAEDVERCQDLQPDQRIVRGRRHALLHRELLLVPLSFPFAALPKDDNERATLFESRQQPHCSPFCLKKLGGENRTESY
jgi:hypothetical protein